MNHRQISTKFRMNKLIKKFEKHLKIKLISIINNK